MPERITSYRDLEVWKRGVELAIFTYQVTAHFPKSETYGLSSQMQRAAVSVPSNIAEGHNRAGREFPRFISFALGSLAELETQALIALRVGLLSEEDYRRLVAECDVIGKMLRVLQKRLGPKP
jgi:four helix bundle protein